MLRSVAPCRADLAGGTLDIWPLGVLHPGALTVNLALPVRVELEIDEGAASGTVEHLSEGGQHHVLTAADALSDLTAAVCFSLHATGGLRIRVRRQAPVGSGLGGSSSYAVALAAGLLALLEQEAEESRLVHLLRDLEARVLSAPTGTQDHWAAVRGGALALHLNAGGEELEELPLNAKWLSEHLAVFFTGITHHSGMVNWQVIRRRLEGDPDTARALTRIADAAGACRQALLDGSAERVGEAVRDEWEARKRLAPEVCPPELLTLEKAALAAGATAFKACGAGGGGSVLVWSEAEAMPRVLNALVSAAPEGRVLARGGGDDGVSVHEGFVTLSR